MRLLEIRRKGLYLPRGELPGEQCHGLRAVASDALLSHLQLERRVMSVLAGQIRDRGHFTISALTRGAHPGMRRAASAPSASALPCLTRFASGAASGALQRRESFMDSPCRLDRRDVDLLHVHHRVERALGG